MRGPKPIPTHLKLIRGNPGKRPVNKSEPQPPRGLPTAPAHLSREARAEWRRVARDLYAAGILTKVDRSILAAYAQSYARWVEASRLLEGADLVVTTHHGNKIQNPLLGICRRAAADMVRYSVELGMSPSSRSRVKALPPAESNPKAVKYLE